MGGTLRGSLRRLKFQWRSRLIEHITSHPRHLGGSLSRRIPVCNARARNRPVLNATGTTMTRTSLDWTKTCQPTVKPALQAMSRTRATSRGVNYSPVIIQARGISPLWARIGWAAPRHLRQAPARWISAIQWLSRWVCPRRLAKRRSRCRVMSAELEPAKVHSEASEAARRAEIRGRRTKASLLWRLDSLQLWRLSHILLTSRAHRSKWITSSRVKLTSRPNLTTKVGPKRLLRTRIMWRTTTSSPPTMWSSTTTTTAVRKIRMCRMSMVKDPTHLCLLEFILVALETWKSLLTIKMPMIDWSIRYLMGR